MHAGGSKLYCNYRVRQKHGKRKPVWIPKKVCDDGKKTFITFSEAMRYRQAPVLHVLDSAENLELVNYRPRGDVYVVDRLFDAARLALGKARRQTVIVIQRASVRSLEVRDRALLNFEESQEDG